MALPKVQKGDVYQLQATNGFCYIQCVKEAPDKELEIIRNLPGVYMLESEENLASIVNQKELFFSHLPLKYALRKKLAKHMGNYPVPKGSEAPRFYRTKHKTGDGVFGWQIVDFETWQGRFRFVATLSDEELQLSPSYMLSIPDIVERIENNWMPLEWK